MDLGGPRPYDGPLGDVLPEATWIEPFPGGHGGPADDPADARRVA